MDRGAQTPVYRSPIFAPTPAVQRTRKLERVSSAFHVENFGCRAARADGEAVAERLRARGLVERGPSAADVVIVNTCSVTAEADRSARAFIRRTHRQNPDARILVTGCYAQRAPAELARMEGVAAVVGNSHKALSPEIAMDLAAGAAPSHFVSLGTLLHQGAEQAAPIWADDHFAHSFLEEAELVPGSQTRPNLKIQEGCGNRCTFCVIPQTRGRSRSLAADSVLAQVRSFVAAGGNELVLSGINLGRWGRDLPAAEGGTRSLAKLVRQIFAETSLPRLRLSSIEPMDWDADLQAVIRDHAGGRLARHAHLPLQSGSDAVLRRMHRRYRPWHYEKKVSELLDAFGPDLTLGADVMVGFPGETDQEFEETCRLIRDLPFGYLHVFPFSARPGTRGWAMHAETPVPPKVAAERHAALVTLGCDKTLVHRRRFLGRVLSAVTLNTSERLSAAGRTSALTDNFLPVEIAGVVEANRLTDVAITSIGADGALTACAAL
ncbi:tRNA (N(6)-L-threonylcarbamoyladenosine(37)-C(2))-methylthiotransferase MtaB [Acidobacteria bacterium AB60]|nr:tRNA (N(6)-L-threonylcarbamoyladenosine(37)-C(2))-methylthiotransferase MtaB [Acidobacteria bacterium AB60]